jgi:amino acid adenylation domain-containing protein
VSISGRSIGQLDDQQRAALAKRALGASRAAERVPVVPRTGGHYPLSYAQRRMWLVCQLEGTEHIYNIPYALRLNGDLNLPALRQAIAAVAQRHEGLRTRFVVRDAEPRQEIVDDCPFELPLVDLCTSDDASQRAEVEAWIAREALGLFDLTSAPLLRLRVLRLGPMRHVLLITMHHIIADGWAAGMLMQEVALHYEAAVERRAPPALPAPLQYVDFAAWEQARLEHGNMSRLVQYWLTQLEHCPAFLDFPFDHARPTVQTYRGAEQTLMLSRELRNALASTSRQAQASLFMTSVAALALVLARYTGQDDIVLGTAVANRTRPELETVMGLLMNMVPIRFRIGPLESFGQHLANVRRAMLDAFAHQEVQFMYLLERLKIRRSASHMPLFQAMVLWQSATREGEISLPGLTERPRLPFLELSPLGEYSPVARYDFTFKFADLAEGLKVGVEYNADLFEAPTIQRLLANLEALMREASSNTEACVALLPVLAPSQQAALTAHAAVATEYDSDTPIHVQIAARALSHPADIAITCAGRSLDFAGLVAASRRVASQLARGGVRPGERVGLCVSRSLEMVIGMLAVLECGAAYVPLDPTYPQARLDMMLEDSGAALLLTEASLVARFDSRHAALSIEDALAQENSIGPPGPLPSDALAYVIYTSGSTGRPKGVPISHRSLNNFFLAMDRMHADIRQSRARWLAVTSICFDISVVELWWTLARGHHVVVQRDWLHDPGAEHPVDVMRDLDITHLQCTPSFVRLLLEHPQGSQGLASLQALMLGGEALAPALAQTLLDLGVKRLINCYGPTEATVWVSHHEVREASASSIPIGTPFPNSSFFILDRHLQPVPIGVAGQLFIAGEGLSSGYWRRPGLTSERFIPNPFGSGSRLYRTGDLARWRDDGSVEFLGRTDHQVKIRGYRVELSEIEAVLGQHPAVMVAVVSEREAPEGRILVAFVQPRRGCSVTAEELKLHCASTLAEYMVPASIALLDELPLTANGKIDRAALACTAPVLVHSEFSAPVTVWEQHVATAWRELLGMETVGRSDNFFDLGGHSLLLVKLHARLSALVKRPFPVTELFRHSTVADTAAFLERHVSEADQRQQPVDARARRAALVRERPSRAMSKPGRR